MPHPPAAVSTAKPDEGSLELTERLIRIRAYRFFEERGSEHGHDLEDWLRAKAEVFGRKPLVVVAAAAAAGVGSHLLQEGATSTGTATGTGTTTTEGEQSQPTNESFDPCL